MHRSAYVTILTFRYLWRTVSQYDTQSLHRYFAISMCIIDPYCVRVMCMCMCAYVCMRVYACAYICKRKFECQRVGLTNI